jgi:two-component sensor histidine kinase
MDPSGPSISVSAASLHRQALVLEFGATLLRELSESQICQEAALKLVEGSGAGHSRVMRYRAESDDLQVCGGVGWRNGMVGSVLSADTTPAGRCYRAAAAVQVDDIMNDARFAPDEALHRCGIVSLLTVPIMTGTKMYGSVEIEGDGKMRAVPEDVPFLQAIARLVGLAVTRRRAAVDAMAAHSIDADLALRELRHRASNNLQTIMAALNIEMRTATEPATAAALQRVIRRVVGIGRAEASLASAAHGGRADLQMFLRGLCATLAMPPGVCIVADLTPVWGERRVALPIGLIVNEAVTNSLKHAFPDQRGTISVALRLISESRARVSVHDDGIGLFENWKPGSGTDIMNALGRSFGATIMRSAGSARGSSLIVEFPTGTHQESELINRPYVIAAERTRDPDE